MTRMHLSTGYRESIVPAPVAWNGTLTRRSWPVFTAPAAPSPIPNASDGPNHLAGRRSVFAMIRAWFQPGKGS